MIARLRLWWQKIKQHRIAIGVATIILLIVIVLIISGYWFDWTGFDGHNKVTVAHIISGTNAGTVTRTEEYQPGKTLWDWLQLLIIPFVLAIGGYLFNLTVSRNERRAADKRDQTERDIALDNQQEATLQEYINKMSELLLNKKLHESKEDDEERKIARARTLTALHRLNGSRKRSLLQFLYETKLIEEGGKIVDLTQANLSEADLCQANLIGADLHGADLRGAKLGQAYLLDATLSQADLRGAKLDQASLFRANLSGAKLNSANLSMATLGGASLNEAVLIGANLSGAILSGANLREARLDGAHLDGADLWKTDLYNANLHGANLDRARLIDANLAGVNLNDANLSYAQLRRVNLSAADHSGLMAVEASFHRAILDSADLTGARGISNKELEKQAKSLKGAIMPDRKMYRNSSGANLREADLREADLSGVDLSGADLTSAGLKDAFGITTEELEKQAKSLKGATMPDGSIHP